MASFASGLSVLSNLFSIGATVKGFVDAGKAEKRAQRADVERRKVSKLQQKISQQEAFKSRLRNIAIGRVERAKTRARQIATGSGGGSAIGALGTSTVSANEAFLQSTGKLAQQASEGLFQASIFSSAASQALSSGNLAIGAAKLATRTPSIFRDIRTGFKEFIN